MEADSFPPVKEMRPVLYQALAEALDGTPPWMSLPGKEWPLTRAAAELMVDSAVTGNVVEALNTIPAEPEAAHRARYRRVFGGSSQPGIWLYESLWRSGRFLGPETIALERLYETVGLQVVGAEAADHVSVELGFLAFLAERQVAEPTLASKWRQFERLFIKKHAGQWLPALGRSLAASGDEVYGPIGALMTAWLTERKRSQRRPKRAEKLVYWPILAQPDLCTLCSFCVQVCPTRALTVVESADETSLRLSASACNGCNKCVRACPNNLMDVHSFKGGEPGSAVPQVLRLSPRVRCPGCGQATFSQAEIDFVAKQLGQLDWLPLCPSCRSGA